MELIPDYISQYHTKFKHNSWLRHGVWFAKQNQFDSKPYQL